MAVVEIKGQNGGLIFVFRPGTVEEYISELKNRFAVNPLLFQGFSVTFRGEPLKKLTSEELSSLQRLCLDHGLTLAVPHVSKTVRERDAGVKDIIIKRTLRSGQKITHNGSVVIMGDVHESAEVIASKDIIVLGRLEGVVHAGCFGDLSSIVLALKLMPRQVRIADKISRPPSDSGPNEHPEMAYIEDGNICVREYRIPISNRRKALN
ncbi:MAG: septum site-determining protein MinC [Syntrophomonadales bacterium]